MLAVHLHRPLMTAVTVPDHAPGDDQYASNCSQADTSCSTLQRMNRRRCRPSGMHCNRCAHHTSDAHGVCGVAGGSNRQPARRIHVHAHVPAFACFLRDEPFWAQCRLEELRRLHHQKPMHMHSPGRTATAYRKSTMHTRTHSEVVSCDTFLTCRCVCKHAHQLPMEQRRCSMACVLCTCVVLRMQRCSMISGLFVAFRTYKNISVL
jgi:hypothetical protein